MYLMSCQLPNSHLNLFSLFQLKCITYTKFEWENSNQRSKFWNFFKWFHDKGSSKHKFIIGVILHKVWSYEIELLYH